ncbi:pullulanase-type alpha-1,6-glucosidase [Chondromyces crocatus]|uniref:pullulanase n=1 Tax=Chondromyces crocatus TaxID=52 RepID=A0A0K1EFM6_CHOCO|nr:pullulanase-type alpha-1,6-glucosidase [Chondromyces crocatus]AKT39497.1 alpha-dextran endo-1,6-alpha-glucosidase [Chondromyces crocatus]
MDRFIPRLRRALTLPLLLSPLLNCDGETPVDPPVGEQPPEEQLLVHYYRPLEDYSGWEVIATGDVPERAAGELRVLQNEADDFGATFVIPTRGQPERVRLKFAREGDALVAGDLEVSIPELGKEVWVFSDYDRAFSVPPAIPEEGTAIIYYRRTDDVYADWGLHLWGDTTTPTDWNEPLLASGQDVYGAWYEVPLASGAEQVNFIIHQGDMKDPGPDQSLRPGELGRRIWVLSGDPTLYTYPGEPPLLNARQAHWVDRETFAWRPPVGAELLPDATFELHYAPEGGIRDEKGQLVGASQVIPLSFEANGLGAATRQKFPHLAGHTALRFPAASLERQPELVKGQLVVVARLPNGKRLATGVQLPGVLDALYATSSTLGVDVSGGAPTLRLWAPTARSVRLHLFDSPGGGQAQVVPMSVDQGVWRAEGNPSWMGRYYLYEVEVFVPGTGRVETNLVTDPYSLSLSMNSQRSQIIDLDAPGLKPAGWDTLVKPQLGSLRDTTLYELHIRDFSISDPSVPLAHRGTFLGFTHPGSNGMTHLSGLAQAGLTHVHLLPAFDFATVNENQAEQRSATGLENYGPSSDEQQKQVWALRSQDGFNWGYDPWHFTVPEGSYATTPDGPSRTLEFRSMVQALNQAGLRVVMDVVYNHTSAAGQDARSVLDRIVPGYYHRLDDNGAVTTSTCCQNTATEHAMMQKLMVDSMLTWARAYKIDGFRFDLMGHHMKENLVEVRDRLAALTPQADGIDGTKLVIYGEGWDFGEVAGNARGDNATQRNMAGTGIGTFNDRLRDAVRGGDPFDSGGALRRQGFASGLYLEPNDHDQGTQEEQLDRLLDASDHIRVGLTGNLRDYAFEDRNGDIVTGADLAYKGEPVGYTLAPGESVTYVEAHDNQTLWDILQLKAPQSMGIEARVRLHRLALSINGLGLGVPFFHAGSEMLRSKSMDRDSYDSGDWFNRLDFTYATNNWGKGLPPQEKNGDSWAQMEGLLADPTLQVEQHHIVGTVRHLEEVLQIRRGSPLFRLATAADVSARVRFHNTGPSQVPGVVVMSISDEISGAEDLDPALGGVVVIFNARPAELSLPLAGFETATLALHPVQMSSADEIVKSATFNAGSFTVPERTAAVFVGSGMP